MYQSGFVFGGAQSSTSSCQKAVSDVTYQPPAITVAAGSGDTLTPIVTVPTGSNAGFGGQVDNRGNCFNLLVTLTKLVGSDCNNCTQNSLTTEVSTVFVKAGDVFNLPGVFWSDISYQVADDTHAVTTTAVAGTFSFYSSYTPACPGCAIVVGGVEPVAK